MKQFPSSYFAALKAWDRTHRLVGREPIEALYAASKGALATHANGSPACLHMVDVGAGSGILGMPWLELSEVGKVVFVEPSLKKAAFLRDFLFRVEPKLGLRCLVLADRIENVSRETIRGFFKNEPFLCAARAFSGGVQFSEALKSSELRAEALYIFRPPDTRSPKSMLEKIAI